ncbi:RNA-processing protein [archaeon]|jgi:ribosomal RNA assembly protein|nr:RNA-processing protein [archaeon]MBT4397632.1 RNA-processing protein [archaeon]MBT4441677.1 RNA-processing protein [archaeon]
MDRKELKIPKERVAVLIGRDGEVKKRLEKKGKISIDIDSQEGDVTIEGESLDVYIALGVVKAIARGFNPTIAEQLFNEKNAFEIIEIQDYVGKSKKDQMRLKGRVIGQEGKARKYIESYCDVKMVVYGKTIGLVGELEKVAMAKQAIEMLLEGSPHGNVYKWLDNKKRELIRREFEG